MSHYGWRSSVQAHLLSKQNVFCSSLSLLQRQPQMAFSDSSKSVPPSKIPCLSYFLPQHHVIFKLLTLCVFPTHSPGSFLGLKYVSFHLFIPVPTPVPRNRTSSTDGMDGGRADEKKQRWEDQAGMTSMTRGFISALRLTLHPTPIPDISLTSKTNDCEI